MRVKLAASLPEALYFAGQILARGTHPELSSDSARYWKTYGFLADRAGKPMDNVRFRGMSEPQLLALVLENPDQWKLVGTTTSSSLEVCHTSFDPSAVDPDWGREWVIEFEGLRGSINQNWGLSREIAKRLLAVEYQTSEPSWEWYESRDGALSRLGVEKAQGALIEARHNDVVADERFDELQRRLVEVASNKQYLRDMLWDVRGYSPPTEELTLEQRKEEHRETALRCAVALLGAVGATEVALR